ncbi:MAG: 3-hydroxyacyl-CoA dehydrogenase NAD-binding domain-containing protein, partial [Chloroflexota bacterium]|nr:3-hydroxyacyl-CoA dehydrogenase NAD-binding domain-containing protein [Chloroflexota bacterium]
MAIRSVGVVGCGLMGGGIAQTCAQSGYETTVLEVNQQFLDKGMTRIYSAWDTMASKGKLSQGQVDENRARLHGTLDLADFSTCDLVIEAVLENMAEKLRLFPKLDGILKADALI